MAQEKISVTASTGTVSRALQLLTVLADIGRTVTVKQISEAMGLAPSSAHRLLNLLRQEGFVEVSAEGRSYGIGPQYYRVAARVLDTVSPRDVAIGVIETIAAEFHETVLFGVYQPAQFSMSFAARADGPNILRYDIALNAPLSLLWGASGKAILAYLPTATIEEVRKRESPSPIAGRPVPTAAKLAAMLEEIRSRGYAASEGEKLPDARGIAAPVFGPKSIIGCLCLTSPQSRLSHDRIEEIGAQLILHAARLSQSLGAPKT